MPYRPNTPVFVAYPQLLSGRTGFLLLLSLISQPLPVLHHRNFNPVIPDISALTASRLSEKYGHYDLFFWYLHPCRRARKLQGDTSVQQLLFPAAHADHPHFPGGKVEKITAFARLVCILHRRNSTRTRPFPASFCLRPAV